MTNNEIAVQMSIISGCLRVLAVRTGVQEELRLYLPNHLETVIRPMLISEGVESEEVDRLMNQAQSLVDVILQASTN